jgi:hypothetical protein
MNEGVVKSYRVLMLRRATRHEHTEGGKAHTVAQLNYVEVCGLLHFRSDLFSGEDSPVVIN